MDLRITPSDSDPSPPRRASGGSRSQAQHRADRIRAFQQELAELEAEGVLALTPEQRDRVQAHQAERLAALAAAYDVDVSDSEKQMSWGVRIAASVGGFAMIAGLVLLFYRYWGDMPTGLQMLVLFAAPLGALWLTGFAAERDRSGYFAGLAAAIAIALFVLDLSALNRIFNLSDSPHGMLAWSLFSLAIGWQFGLRIALAAGVVFGVAWLPAALFYWNGYSADQWLKRPEPVAALSALVFAGALFLKKEPAGTVLRVTSAVLYFLAVLLLAGMNGGSLLGMDLRTSERVYDVLGFVSSAALVFAGVRMRWPAVVYTALGAFVIFLWIRLHRWFWDLLPQYLFFLLVGAISIGLVFVFLKMRRRIQMRMLPPGYGGQAYPAAPYAGYPPGAYPGQPGLPGSQEPEDQTGSQGGPQQ